MTEKNIWVTSGQPMSTFGGQFSGTGLDGSSGGSGSSNAAYYGARGAGAREHDAIQSARHGIDDAYIRSSRNLPATVEAEVSKAKAEVGTDPLSPVETLAREVGVYDKLIAEKTLEVQNLTPVAQEFNGGDPLVASFNDIREKAKTTPAQSKYLVPLVVAMRLWDSSYKAGTQIKLLNEMIALLTSQSAPVRGGRRKRRFSYANPPQSSKTSTGVGCVWLTYTSTGRQAARSHPVRLGQLSAFSDTEASISTAST